MIQEIQQRIEKLSRENKQKEIVEFLKDELKNMRISAQELYDYAKQFYWDDKSVKTNYVLTAETINLLGVVISSLKLDPEYTTKLFKLAADRESNWGCRNYAFQVCNTDLKKALKYIQKALELSDKQEKQNLQLCYSKILWLNSDAVLSNKALNEYLNYKTQLYYQNKARHQPDIEAAIKIAQERLAAYHSAIEKGNELSQCEVYSAELAPFLDGYVVYLSLYAPVLSKAAYLKGYLHECLNQPAQAMQAYSKMTDTKHGWYATVVAARERLLQEEVIRQLQPSSAVDKLAITVANLTVTSPSEASQQVNDNHTLPSMWQKGSDFFDFVDVETRDRLLDEKNALLKKSVREKYESIETLEQQLTNEKNKKSRLEIQKQIKQLEEDITNLRKKYSREPEDYNPERREILRRHWTERHFFNPKRTRKKTSLTELSGKILHQRYNHANNNRLTPLALTDISTRHFITAEATFQASASSLMEVTKQYNSANLGIPVCRKQSWGFEDGPSGENTYGPVEYYQVSGTSVTAEHRADPKIQRLGDSYLPQHGTYDKIFIFLNGLTDGEAEKEKILASYMIRYGQKHQTVTLAELQAINPYAQDRDVDEFNRVCFLIMEKEQGQWHSATSESFQLGMAVSQARCLILLKEGVLRFEEVFKNNAKYGVYSQKGMIRYPSDVAKACKEIDIRYKAYLLTKEPPMLSDFFKPSSETSQPPYMVLSRKQARADLLHVYGGESDTDGEGYESDITISQEDSRPWASPTRK